jgi:hypothetical protein
MMEMTLTSALNPYAWVVCTLPTPELPWTGAQALRIFAASPATTMCYSQYTAAALLTQADLMLKWYQWF